MSKISVIGSINMDLVVTSDKMPGKGETVIGKDFHLKMGGKGANQAVAIARLKGDVEIFGCVGADVNGELVAENLSKNGVSIQNMKPVTNTPTGIALINVAENDNCIIVVPGSNGLVNKEYIDEINEKVKESKIVLLQHEIPVDTIEYVIDLCHANGVCTILNPAPAKMLSKELIEKLDYIIPNEHETRLIFGADKDIEEVVKDYPNKLIVTLGEDGVMYYNGSEVVNAPCIKVDVVDTTGAGDTFCGAFAKAISDDMNIEDAIAFAQYAGGMSVEKLGVQEGMPTLSQLVDRMNRGKR